MLYLQYTTGKHTTDLDQGTPDVSFCNHASVDHSLLVDELVLPAEFMPFCNTNLHLNFDPRWGSRKLRHICATSPAFARVITLSNPKIRKWFSFYETAFCDKLFCQKAYFAVNLRIPPAMFHKQSYLPLATVEVLKGVRDWVGKSGVPMNGVESGTILHHWQSAFIQSRDFTNRILCRLFFLFSLKTWEWILHRPGKLRLVQLFQHGSSSHVTCSFIFVLWQVFLTGIQILICQLFVNLGKQNETFRVSVMR